MKLKIILIIFISCACLTGWSWAYNEDTVHPKINENAVAYSSLDAYLKNNMGMSKGIDEKYDGKSIVEWIKFGGTREDVPEIRGLNHYHDPLKPWESAGLWGTAKSSIIWAQDQTGSVLGPWMSWKFARDTYYEGLLTTTNSRVRESRIARAFQAVGQVMHLVADMAVPAHTRNAAHPVGEPYEKYTKLHVDDLNYSSVTIPKDIFNYAVANSAAPIPISALWDMDRYNGTAVYIGDYIGLAEITNANFMSETTIFTAYPHPAYANTESLLQPVTAADGTVDNVWYLKGKNVGYLTELLAKYKYFKMYVDESGDTSDVGLYYLDDQVHNAYAQKLIPLAVGYTTALLDYFFRGQIELSLPASGVYSKIDDPALSGGGFKQLKVLAKNVTPNDEEMSEGSISLIVKYKTAIEDPFVNRDRPTQVSDIYKYIVVSEANGRQIIPRDNPVELIFNLSAPPIPLYATDVYIQVVYKGKLGSENGAVAVGFKDISEPTPIDFYNNMDWICINNKWYTAGTAEAIKQVDPKNTGIPGWDIYKHNLKDLYYGIFQSGSTLEASPANYTFKTDILESGKLDRHFILSDYKMALSYYATPKKTTEDDLFMEIEPNKYKWSGNAIKNQEERVESQEECAAAGWSKAPCNIRRYPLFYPFRGIEMWGEAGVILDNPKYPTNTSCDWQNGPTN